MKKTLLLVVGMLLIASLASAQAGQIQLYADPGLVSCSLPDAGVFHVYVYHINTSGATASQFSVVPQGGATVSFLGSTSPFPLVTGSPPTGIAVAYGSCLGANGPFQILDLSYIGFGTSPVCSYLLVTDDPRADPPDIGVTDCMGTPNLLSGDGSTATINADVSCPCVTPLPVEDSSWGKIKALYR
jgi:hypothetical protein